MKTFSEFLTEALNESVNLDAAKVYYDFVDEYHMNERCS